VYAISYIHNALYESRSLLTRTNPLRRPMIKYCTSGCTYTIKYIILPFERRYYIIKINTYSYLLLRILESVLAKPQRCSYGGVSRGIGFLQININISISHSFYIFLSLSLSFSLTLIPPPPSTPTHAHLYTLVRLMQNYAILYTKNEIISILKIEHILFVSLGEKYTY